MHTILALAFVLLTQAPTVSEVTAENAAFAQIGAELKLAAKKKLVQSFEKNFPKSDRLPELYMELSRFLIARSDFAAARQYAERGVAAVARMKNEAVASGDQDLARQAWLHSLNASTTKNLAWVKDMAAWQEKQVRSSVLRKR